MKRRGRQRSRGIAGAEYSCAILAIAALAWLMLRLPTPAPPPTRLSGDEARSFNAAVPFVAARLQPASAFHFRGSLAGREQATRCLATAALYEAGRDPQGQKAVIQVILNRVRSGRFAKTICGVVYQGSAAATGCQFSFTCDESAARRPQHEGWEQARLAARRALAGYVFRPVGQATHYHADYVVPEWMHSLDKIAQVHAHIFYREPA